MSDLLFEIGCEEIPSSYIKICVSYLKNIFRKLLNNRLLNFRILNIYATSRRIVICVKKISLIQPILKIEKVNSQNQSDNILYKSGCLVKELLPKILQKLISTIPFPKKMKWDSSNLLFSRPIRRMYCLFENKHLSIKYGNIESSFYIIGNINYSFNKIIILGVNEYFNLMKNNFILLSEEERKKRVLSKSIQLLKKNEGILNKNEDLLEQVANMVEYPFIFLAKYKDDMFHKIPQTLLNVVLKENQRYLVLSTEKNNTVESFILILGVKEEKNIIEGNIDVLLARYKDLFFYYLKDLNITINLLKKKIKEHLFYPQLGSLSDKVNRIKKNAYFLCKVLKKKKIQFIYTKCNKFM